MDARRLSHYLRAILKPGDRSRHTCRLALDARRLSHNLRLLSPKAEVVLPAASSRIRGGCRLLAALPWMRGGCRTACDLEAVEGRSRLTCRPGVDLSSESSYPLPRRGCEAAVALPATWMLGDELITSAALPCIRGGCRFTCRIAVEIIGGDSHLFAASPVDARRPSSYLLSGCPDAAVVIPASSRTTGGGCRLACRLAVDARRLSHYRRPECLDAAVVIPASSPWMRGGCRTTCDF